MISTGCHTEAVQVLENGLRCQPFIRAAQLLGNVRVLSGQALQVRSHR